MEASGRQVAHGPDIAPDMPAAERTDYGTVKLTDLLKVPLIDMPAKSLIIQTINQGVGPFYPVKANAGSKSTRTRARPYRSGGLDQFELRDTGESVVMRGQGAFQHDGCGRNPRVSHGHLPPG